MFNRELPSLGFFGCYSTAVGCSRDRRLTDAGGFSSLAQGVSHRSSILLRIVSNCCQLTVSRNGYHWKRIRLGPICGTSRKPFCSVPLNSKSNTLKPHSLIPYSFPASSLKKKQE